MDVELLICEIAANPPVWDKKHKNYFNRIVTDRIWDSIAKNINVTKEECKKKFKYLKDEYRKALRKVPQPASGAAAQTHVSKFKYFELMGFMRDDSSLQGESNIEYILDDISIFDDNTMTSITFDDHPTTSKQQDKQHDKLDKQQNKKRKTNEDDAYLDIERKKLKLLEADIERTNEDSDDLQFFRSLLPYVKDLSPTAKLELSIINTVLEFRKSEELKNCTNLD